MTWKIRIPVRSYELDTLGHLNHAVYHQYGEVARVEGFAAAGCQWGDFVTRSVAPVLLSSTIHFRREVRGGEQVDVTCAVKFGSGKTFNTDSLILKLDGTVAAEITCVLGMMDLKERRLVQDPRAILEEFGFDPTALPA